MMPPQHCVSYLIGLLLLIGSNAALKCLEHGSRSPGRELVCYTRSYDANQLENAVCQCTTLVHQGHDLQSLDPSELKSLRNAAKEANPDIRIVMSISDSQEILKSSKTTRQDAATYLGDIIKEVDGVELNVTAGSKERLISFVKGLKDELVNKSIDKMILLALPTKPEDLAKQFELKELAKYVDVFTVATHYLRDNDEAYHSFHPSRLMGLFDMLNTDSLVDLISGMGAPKQKILISAPSSAYQFTLKKAEENTPRSPTIEEQPIALDRKKLCDVMNDGEWTVERDEDLTAPYAFKNTSWIAFEDETSLKIKGKYVMLRELAGLGLRDVENDAINDCGASVIETIYKSFKEMKRKTREALLSSLEKDLKDSKISYPRHVRSSDFRIVRVVDTEGKIQTVREDTRTAFTCSRQGYFVHPRSCNRFYRCVKFNQGVDDYSVFEFDCPAGLAFDESSEVCTWPGSLPRGSACPGSSEIEPVPRGRFRCPNHPGFYADPQNCRWFFACYDLGGPEMVPYEFRCPFGLVFDEHKLVCEWPWKVPNCNGPGHGDSHSVYNFGNYGGQDGGDVPQGGIVGVGGFVGQGGSAGSVYDAQNGQDFGNNAHNGQNYNNNGNYDSQAGNAAGAFASQGGYNGQAQNGGDYDGQSYNADYDGQTYNGAAAGFGSQNNNAGGFAGANSGYDGQAYNNAEGAGIAGAIYNGQPQNPAGADYDGQAYNSGETDYDQHKYNPAEVAVVSEPRPFAPSIYNRPIYQTTASSVDYDGQNYGGTGVDYNNEAYNGNSQAHIGAGKDYNNQAYDGGNVQSHIDVGKDYNSQNYDGNTQLHEDIGKDYNNQHFDGDTQSHISVGRPVTVKPTGYDSQSIVTPSVNYEDRGTPTPVYNYAGQGSTYATASGKTTQFNAGAFQTTVGVNNVAGDTRVPSGFTAGTATNYAGQGSTYATDSGKTTQFNAGAYQTTVGVNNVAGDTRVPSGFTAVTATNYGGQGSTYATDSGKTTQFNAGTFQTTAGVNNFGGNTRVPTGFTSSTATNYAGQGSTHATDSGKTTQFNAGAFQTTVGVNNVAGDTRVPSGFTAGTATNYGGQGSTYATDSGKTTQFNAGTFQTTAGVNNFGGNTRVPTGFTSGTATNYAGEVGSTTGYASGVTTGYANNGFTGGFPTAYDAKTTAGYTGENTVGYAAGSTVGSEAGTTAGATGFNNLAGQTGTANGYTGGSTAGYAAGSTTGYAAGTTGVPTGFNIFAGQTGTTIGGYNYAQNNYGSTGAYGDLQTNTFGSDVSQYTGGLSTTVYNSTYSPNLGYPSSTILPSKEKESTDDYQGTKPINSMGLSTSESFGNQYTNQAKNSFTNNGKTTAEYASYNPKQTTQNYNVPTSFYGNTNTAGGTKTTAGLGKFGSTLDSNYNTGTNAYNANDNNSPLIGSSLAPSNEITKYNDNTSGYTGSTYYNKGTSFYQNPYTTAGYAKTSAQNGVTPSTIIQSYNTQGTPVSGVFPQTDSRPVVELENSGIFGTTDTGSIPGSKFPTTQYSGYKTDDIQDYKTPSYTGIPNSFIINAGNGENEQSTILKAGEQTTTEVYTRGGFTKTGATKTGITTAQVGGTGSYVIGTGTPRQRPNPQYIGEHAFSTNTAPIGTATNFGTAETTTNVFAANQNTNFATSGVKGNTNNFETTGVSSGSTATTDYIKSNTATNTNANFAGYSYAKPSVPFVTNYPSTSPDATQTPYYVSTTPASVKNQNSVILDGTNAGFSSTISPVGYTTDQAENFRTTIYQATKLPQKVSTVRPVIDTGSRTVISSTAVPAVVTTQRPIYENNIVSTTPQTYLDVGVSFDQGNYDYTSFAQGATGSSDYSDITSNFDQGIFGQKIGGQTQFTNNYPQPSTNSPLVKQNNELIKSTDGNYNAFTLNSKEFTAQTKSVRINQGNGYRSRINIPNQVYLSSTTLAPVAGVTFRRPIVAAAFNQKQNSGYTYPVPNKVFLENQASYGYNSERGNNAQTLRNQAELGVTPEGAARTYFNNQAEKTFTGRGNTRFSSNPSTGKSIVTQNQGFTTQPTSSLDQNRDSNGKLRTLVGSQVVTSFGNTGYNNALVRQNTANRGNLKVEAELNTGSRTYQSTTLAPEITTYTGDYSRSRLQSSTRNQNKKVIVKLSDLHPLILGKLGAECTCRADPFALFRGQNRQSLPINSQNRGLVDLANYDESEIYVDVGSDKENQSEIDFAKNIPSNRLIKTSNVNYRGQVPTSTYLPPSSRLPTTYLPPKPATLYLPSSTPAPFSSSALRQSQTPNRQPLLIRVEDNYANRRAGKALFGSSDKAVNNLRTQSTAFNRYGSENSRENGETFQEGLDCARPGLFRHPKHCNKFYACHWDDWKKKYTLHVFNCPVHLAFDTSAGACNYPSKGPACQDNKLLV